MKIPVLHYEEVKAESQLKGVVFGSDRYVVTDENGTQYIVEVWL